MTDPGGWLGNPSFFCSDWQIFCQVIGWRTSPWGYSHCLGNPGSVTAKGSESEWNYLHGCTCRVDFWQTENFGKMTGINLHFLSLKSTDINGSQCEYCFLEFFGISIYVHSINIKYFIHFKLLHHFHGSLVRIPENKRKARLHIEGGFAEPINSQCIASNWWYSKIPCNRSRFFTFFLLCNRS